MCYDEWIQAWWQSRACRSEMTLAYPACTCCFRMFAAQGVKSHHIQAIWDSRDHRHLVLGLWDKQTCHFWSQGKVLPAWELSSFSAFLLCQVHPEIGGNCPENKHGIFLCKVIFCA